MSDLINKDSKPTTPFKLATGTKSSVSHLRVLLFPCVVRKATEYVGTQALNMCHQLQKDFLGILVEIPHHQKGYLFYITHPRKIISSYYVFCERFYSALEYMSQPHAEAVYMRPAVPYTPYATSPREKTGNIIMFAQFEEGNLLSKN